MMMFTRPVVRAVTAKTVPMLCSRGKQSSLSPRAGCYFSSLVERSSTADGRQPQRVHVPVVVNQHVYTRSTTNMNFLTMNQSSYGGNNITTNDTIRNNNNVVFFNNNIVGQFPVPVHDVAGSSFSSSAAALSLVRNNQTTMQAVVHATNNVEQEQVNTLIQTSNRNNRRTKKANKGSRPCNRTGRRKRKEAIGSRKRSR